MRLPVNYLAYIYITLLILGSCSRPAAYVPPEHREHFSRTEKLVNTINQESDLPTDIHAASAGQVLTAPENSDAVVRNDSRLMTTKISRQRLNRSLTSFGAKSANDSREIAKLTDARRMTSIQRIMLKKLAKRLSHHPADTQKTAVIEGILVLGAILLLGGVLLVLFSSGTGFALGVIGLAAGLVCLLIGLF